MALQPLVGPWLFLQFVIFFTQTVGLLGRVINLSQAAFYTQGNTNCINAHTDNRAFSGIRTQDPSVRATEDSSCLRPRGHSFECQHRAEIVHP
jgi:hypothetical protein